MSADDLPEVVLLDGDYDVSLHIAKEIARDIDVYLVGVGASRYSRLFYSRYCDESTILPVPGDAGYEAALLDMIQDRRPDVVVPIGYRSVAALETIRTEVPDTVALPLPPPDSFETAVDKRKTLSLAAEHGIDVPADLVDRAGEGDGSDPIDSDDLPYPVFLKPRREVGGTHSARVTSPETFWREYVEIERTLDGQEVLVQESVDGDGNTYACGLLCIEGEVRLSFGHVEVRSVPRRGGSGTRLRAFDDPHMESMSAELLESLDWHGVALVEYRRTDDAYVLMEVNPKFWASYALASQCGYRFASTLVAELLDLPNDAPAGTTDGERVFPLREFAYCLRNFEDESLLRAVGAMAWPPTRPDVNVEDIVAWLIPPINVSRKSALVRTYLGAMESILGRKVRSDE